MAPWDNEKRLSRCRSSGTHVHVRRRAPGPGSTAHMSTPSNRMRSAVSAPGQVLIQGVCSLSLTIRTLSSTLEASTRLKEEAVRKLRESIDPKSTQEAIRCAIKHSNDSDPPKDEIPGPPRAVSGRKSSRIPSIAAGSSTTGHTPWVVSFFPASRQRSRAWVFS